MVIFHSYVSLPEGNQNDEIIQRNSSPKGDYILYKSHQNDEIVLTKMMKSPQAREVLIHIPPSGKFMKFRS